MNHVLELVTWVTYVDMIFRVGQAQDELSAKEVHGRVWASLNTSHVRMVRLADD